MRKVRMNPDTVGAPVGAYSHAVRVELDEAVLVFVSGQVAIDQSGELVGKGDVVAQAEQVFRNLEAILTANGATFADVVKLNSYLTDMSRLPELRDVRNRFITGDFPASTAVGVTGLYSPDALVEIEAVAVVPTTGEGS